MTETLHTDIPDNTIHHIYDKVFKKILTLSSTAVINLINGLFDTDYPTNSTITYNWTEFEDDHLRKTLADTIITINGCHSYHMEAQTTPDDEIIFRVFDYGYSHAERNRTHVDDGCILTFPEPRIIYLYSEKPVPEVYTLTLDFGSQGIFEYKVSTCNYQAIPIEELNRRKMVILIPFSLLRLRDAIKQERTPDRLLQLKTLIQDGIIGSINKNLTIGNITQSDARRLRSLTQKLYDHLYAHYEEMEELNDMTDESLILEYDIIEKEHEAELAQMDAIISEKETTISKMDIIISEKDNIISEKDDIISEKDDIISEKENIISEKENIISEKENIISEKEEEILQLRRQLEALTK